MDNKVGKAVYTLLLNDKGGIRSDLIIARMGKNSFRVITGGGHGGVDKKWFIDNLPADGLPSSMTRLLLWERLVFGVHRPGLSWSQLRKMIFPTKLFPMQASKIPDSGYPGLGPEDVLCR